MSWGLGRLRGVGFANASVLCAKDLIALALPGALLDQIQFALAGVTSDVTSGVRIGGAHFIYSAAEP
jgi:hypothetical protein